MALGASGRIKHCEFEEASGELPQRDALLRCEISPLTRKAIRNPN